MNNIKILESYIDYIVNYDFSLIEDEYVSGKLRLGAMFIDRVCIAYYKNVIYKGVNIIDLVDKLDIESLSKVEDKIKYLLDILKVVTNIDHPLVVFMFFGCDSIESKLYYKFKY